MLTINGASVEAPTEMSVAITDIDVVSNRNANGTMVRNRVAVKRKIECKWGLLTTSQISTILSACSGVSFPITYLDPQIGASTTKTFYPGDRTSPIFFQDGTKGWVWKDLKINFVEV